MLEPTPLTGWLAADHRAIDALLDRAAAADPLDLAAYHLFRARLLRHIAVEEKVLFPAARQGRGGVSPTWASRVKEEHAAITSLLVPAPDRALVAQLRSLLEPHDRLEEGPLGVYAECEELIGARWPEVLERAMNYPDVKVAPLRHGRAAGRRA
jgi:hypothetical protein